MATAQLNTLHQSFQEKEKQNIKPTHQCHQKTSPTSSTESHSNSSNKSLTKMEEPPTGNTSLTRQHIQAKVEEGMHPNSQAIKQEQMNDNYKLQGKVECPNNDSHEMQDQKQVSTCPTSQHAQPDHQQIPQRQCNSQLPQKFIYQPEIISVMKMIRDGLYSRNRSYLHGWLRRQCLKFKLQFQTYANALSLMDQYYKYCPFQKQNFVMTTLCMTIISSKAIEPKVLYTSTVSKANKFDYDETLKKEASILTFFQFEVTAFNFVRVATEYMRRWDCAIMCQIESKREYLFLEDGQPNYLQFLQALSLCQSHLRFKGSILRDDVKRILLFVLRNHYKENNEVMPQHIIDAIFAVPCREATHQLLFAYEIKQESEEDLSKNLSEWKVQFQTTKQDLAKRYDTYAAEKEKYRCYGQFLCMLA